LSQKKCKKEKIGGGTRKIAESFEADVLEEDMGLRGGGGGIWTVGVKDVKVGKKDQRKKKTKLRGMRQRETWLYQQSSRVLISHRGTK